MPPTHTPNGVTTEFREGAMLSDWQARAMAILTNDRSDSRHAVNDMMIWADTAQGETFWNTQSDLWDAGDPVSDDVRMILSIWLGLWTPTPAIIPWPEGLTAETGKALAEAVLAARDNWGMWTALAAGWPNWHNGADHNRHWGVTAEGDDFWNAQHEIIGGGIGNSNSLSPEFRQLLQLWAGAPAVPEPGAPEPVVATPLAGAWVEPPFVGSEARHVNDLLAAMARVPRDYGDDQSGWPAGYAIMYPGDDEDDAFATFDASPAAEEARRASRLWPVIQTHRRNYTRRNHLGLPELPMPAPLARVGAPATARKPKALKRVNVEAIKQKHPGINGATAGCTCTVCAKLRKEATGTTALDARNTEQKAFQKDFLAKGRTFGVELELFFPPSTAAAEVGLHMHKYAALKLTEAGAKARNGAHLGDTHWGVKDDGSLSPSKSGDVRAEVVSPILRGEAGLGQVRKVVEALNGLKAYVNKSAGLHVHVGAKDLTLSERRNLLSQFIRYEGFFDLILPASRRSNRYAESLRSRASATKNKSIKAAEHVILKLLEVTTEDQLNRIAAWTDHHGALADARYKHGTFEFRQHSGSVNAEKIINWIRLVLAFTEAAKDKPALPFYSRKISDEEEMEKFFETFSIPRDLRAYYRKRHAALFTNPDNDD